MVNDVVIRVENLWKSYTLKLETLLRLYQLAKGDWRGALTGRDSGRAWALQDINLEIRRGESLGIIGPNGAGKSTLLKILAGVTLPTRGKVQVQGRVFPMIELSAGLSPDLTGRENVYLLGGIAGLSRREVRVKMPEIEEFCELGEFFDKPVWTYSSGMLARLGFGVAINVDADILLVDEVLAVGDFAFQNKCHAHFRHLRRCRSDQTLIYVTHNLVSLPYICDKTIYLANGVIKVMGPSQNVIAQYEKEALLQPTTQPDLQMGEGVSRDTSGHVELLSMQVTDYSGQAVDMVESGQGFCLSVEGFCDTLVTSPLFAFAILDPGGNICWWNLSAEDGYEFGPLKGYFRVTARIPPLPLRTGRYTVNFAFRDGDGFVSLERLRSLPLLFQGEGRAHGILAVKAEWRLDRGDDAKK